LIAGDSGIVYMQGTKNTGRGLEWYYTDDNRYGMCQDTNGIVRIFIANAYSPGSIRFCRATSATAFTDLMTCTYTGNIGIGTTSPGSQLTMYSGTSNNAIDITGTTQIGLTGRFTSGGYLSFVITDTSHPDGYSWRFQDNSALINGGLYFRVKYSSGDTYIKGKLGIGTESPSGGLHVRTTTQVSLYTEQYSGVGNQGSGIQCWNTNIFSPTIDNQMSCGWSTFRWTTVYATTGTINTSDSRQKMNISPSNLGLNFISNLNPVSYSWIDGGTPATEPNVVGARSGKRTFYGFLAQEVKKTLDVMGTGDFAGWTLDDPKDPDSTQGLRYTEFIAPMVKAIQELSSENTALKQSLASVTARLDSLESRLAAANI